MKNFINESWVAVLVLVGILASGYGLMHAFVWIAEKYNLMGGF
jgi:hypothetical protein